MRRILLGSLLAVICVLGDSNCPGGMPSPLPTQWTADNPSSLPGYDGASLAAQHRWQAISFFIVALLLSAWGVRWLWNSLARDFTKLPRLTYGRAISVVILWGLLFVVVLTMISGARELMTPGAWRKQGWTYKLAEAKTSTETDLGQRRERLEKLRFELWRYAASHSGQFPTEVEVGAMKLLEMPGSLGFRYLYVPGKKASDEGQLLVYEPAYGDGDRFVLLTNGVVGNIPKTELDKLRGEKQP